MLSFVAGALIVLSALGYSFAAGTAWPFFGLAGTESNLAQFSLASPNIAGEPMARDEHNKAAEHHESAAKSHRAAPEHHGKGDHAKGKEHSSAAQQHSQTARQHSEQAHAKSQQQK